MLFLKNKITLFLAVLLLTALSAPLQAKAIDTASSSVLRFQHKMAEKGHAEYQYKLARMYESGTNIQRNLDNARHWYELAAKQHYKPAEHRLVYLEIQQHKFQPQHQPWLEVVKREARYNDPEALFLLGQIYAEGLGVEQDFKKSLTLLRKASAANITESETEIRRVEKLVTEAQEREEKAQRLEQELEQQRLQEAQRIARQKQLQQQQAAQLQQQKLREKQQKQRANEEKARQQATIVIAPKKLAPPPPPPEETSANDICSGHNRFLATCR